MTSLIGAALGYFVGVLTWLAARHLVSGYRGERRPTRGLRSVLAVHGRISPPAAIVQAGMALWSAFLSWRGLSPRPVLAGVVVTGILTAISLVDLQVHRIPNALCVALVACAGGQVLWLGQPTIERAALGLLAGGGLLALVALAGRGAMGAGDVKLAAALGALLGYPLILRGLLWGTVAGGAAALVLLVTGRTGRNDYIAYGPYLALGGWIVWIRVLELWL